MKFLGVILLALAVSSTARHITLEDVIDFEENTAYGYHTKIGIPLADKIRKEEDNLKPSRIIGGSLVDLEEFPYQVSPFNWFYKHSYIHILYNLSGRR